MSIQKQVSDHLKSDGISLMEDDLQSVIRLFNCLAKIEYEVYRQQKYNSNHGQLQEPQDISLNNKKTAA